MVVGARARAVRRGTSIIYSLLPPGEVEDAGDHELAAAVGGGGGDDGGGAGVLIRRARAARCGSGVGRGWRRGEEWSSRFRFFCANSGYN